MDESYYDLFNSTETEEERKKNIQRVLNEAEKKMLQSCGVKGEKDFLKIDKTRAKDPVWIEEIMRYKPEYVSKDWWIKHCSHFDENETLEQRKKRITFLIDNYDEAEERKCNHFFMPEETMYYQILARNPKDFDDVRIDLYEYYACQKCGIGYYKIYITKEDGITKPIRSKISILKAEGLINLYQRGEPWVEEEEKEKFGT